MVRHVRRVLPALIGCALLMVSIAALRDVWHTVRWAALVHSVASTSVQNIAAAVCFTGMSYLTLTGADFVAFAHARATLPPGAIVRTALLAQAIGNSVGFGALSSVAVRYRLYSQRGVAGDTLSHVLLSCVVTSWLGLFALGGLTMATTAHAPLHDILPAAGARAVGWLLAVIPCLFLVAAIVRPAAIASRRPVLSLPSPTLACAQLTISCVDWMMAAAALYAVLPSHLPIPVFLCAFLVASLLGVASHVPGGLGVFEGQMALQLAPYMAIQQLAPALMLYRTAYYVVPFVLAVLVLAVEQLRQRRS